MRLTKHHGLHNDFLILLDDSSIGRAQVDGGLARQVCERRTGVGADGFIHAFRPPLTDIEAGVDVVMRLYNADGTRAETSGNGLRCLGQALSLQRVGGGDGAFHVQTDAGLRQIEVTETGDGQTHAVAVEMGAGSLVAPSDANVALVDAVLSNLGLGGPTMLIDLGNPHLVVLVEDPAAVEVESVGAELAGSISGGANVEFIRRTGEGSIELRVRERGVGETMACGSGACASVFAAAEWGLVDAPETTVSMRGGEATVSRRGDHFVLTGPAVHIASLDYFGG